MIYPSDFESKIGFNALRDIISSRCVSPIGASLVGEMNFLTSFNKIKSLLEEVKEMMSLIEGGVALPLTGIVDTREWMSHLTIEGNYLSEDALLKIMQLLKSAADTRSVFTSEDIKASYPVLSASFGSIPALKEVIREISSKLTDQGTVKDNASESLMRIRRDIASATSSMSGVIRRIIDRGIAGGYLAADTSASVRDGRMVIPVAAADHKKVTGVIHDQSATGKTYFIEPVEVITAQNRIRELKLEERKEIITILIKIATHIHQYASDINYCSKELGRLDFIRAKAIVAIETGAGMPHLQSSPAIEWYHAVHPILFFTLKKQNRDIVPLDITLSNEHRILVISGPNAGGKSVTLKTVAIVQYMMQCGVMPALYENSHMGVFDKIFIDIGDEQSIENDLSTYSSHLRNMKMFIKHASESTLFLADEMGSGTEPQIGGAIAQAILSNLNKAGAFGIVTTHYQNLKAFANSEPGLINGAMLYDRQHLQPLFQLSIGSPGSSFALEIARKSGLPPDVIHNAKKIVGSEYVDTDKYILDLVRDKRYWANKRTVIKEKEAKIDALIAQLTQKTDEIKSKRASYIKEAKKEANEILKTANSKIENAVKEIRAAEADREKTKLVRQELESYKRAVANEMEQPVGEHADLSIEKLKRKGQLRRVVTPASRKNVSDANQPLVAGDYVKMVAGGSVGKILAIKGNKAEIAFGALRTFINIDQLKRTSPPAGNASQMDTPVVRTISHESRSRQLNFKSEIDLRGYRVDEALQAVTYFIDDAMQFGISRVRILHGTGTGALKTAIRQLLQTNNAVKSFHDEDVRFGGAGITIVNLE